MKKENACVHGGVTRLQLHEKRKCMCSWRRYEASAPRSPVRNAIACVHGGLTRLQL